MSFEVCGERFAGREAMMPLPARPVVVVAVRLPGRGEDHAAATG